MLLKRFNIIGKSMCLCAVVGLTLATTLSFAQSVNQDKVDHIKAAYIFHMAQLTTWPTATLNEISSLRIVFIGAGTDKLAGILENKTTELLIQGRRLEVSHFSAPPLGEFA